MFYRPKVVRCRLKTGGKSIEQIKESHKGQGLVYRDFESLQQMYDAFSGLVVELSLWKYDNHESYHLKSWKPEDDKKVMMGVYYAEQTHPFPRYKNDFEKFKAVWEEKKIWQQWCVSRLCSRRRGRTRNHLRRSSFVLITYLI